MYNLYSRHAALNGTQGVALQAKYLTCGAA
jgi:hypothetical protein